VNLKILKIVRIDIKSSLKKIFPILILVKKIEKENEDDEDEDDPPIICNGFNKRKLSTDSSDSNPTRSQRVPDVILSKITENGTDKSEHKLKGKILNQTKHSSSLNTNHN